MKKNIQHLLLIRFSAMGDVAIAAPLVRSLTLAYPNLKITILTKPFFAPIFEGIAPQVQVFKADFKNEYKGFLGVWKLFKTLNKLQIDAVADLHSVLRTHILRLFFALHGTLFVRIDKGRADKKKLTALKNKELSPIRSSFLRYADVVAKIGAPIDTSTPCFLPQPPLSKEVESWLTRGKKYIGIAPFAAHQAKEYPLDKIKIIIEQLSQDPQHQILLFGGKNDAAKLQVLEKENVRTTAGKLSFTQELELISRLDVMLAMDSGNGHLAAMYGVKTITLWGVTHPCLGFAPYFQPNENQILANRTDFPLIPTSVFGNKYPKGYEKAISSISTTQIIETIKKVIH